MNLRRAEKSDFLSFGRLGVEIFDMFDDDIARTIEQRAFEFLLRLDVYAVDDRRATLA